MADHDKPAAENSGLLRSLRARFRAQRTVQHDRWLTRLRIGRRGSILMIVSIMYGLFALQLYPESTEPVWLQRTAILFFLAPPQVWQIIWFIVVAVALSRVFSKHDALGFSLLETLAAIWAGGQLTAFIVYHVFAAAVFAAIWFGILIILRIIDGWAELPRGFVESIGHHRGDPRLPGDPRDPRDPRLAGDPRDPRDPRLFYDEEDGPDRPRRPERPSQENP